MATLGVGDETRERERGTNLVQDFLGLNPGLWKIPVVVLPHYQVERPIQFPIQSRQISLPVRLRLPTQRPLNPQPILKTQPLTILTHPALRFEVQPLPNGIWVRQIVALVNQQLVVPLQGPAAVDTANLAGHGAAPLEPFDLEVDSRGLALAEEELLGEGCRQPLVEALLIEIEGVLEGCMLAREQRRAGEDEAGVKAIVVLVVGRVGVAFGTSGC